MTGETNLHILLKTLDPVLDERQFGFCAIERQSTPVLGFKPLGVFEEEEGATIIATVADLESADLKFSGPWAKITLRVHSSLTAVGLTAAVSAALAVVGVSANVVAGCYHDHIFVPWRTRDRALAALRRLSADEG
jgi:uncharacterized protein